MTKKRQRRSADFKFRVALAARRVFQSELTNKAGQKDDNNIVIKEYEPDQQKQLPTGQPGA